MPLNKKAAPPANAGFKHAIDGQLANIEHARDHKEIGEEAYQSLTIQLLLARIENEKLLELQKHTIMLCSISEAIDRHP
jgi:hypothetical protein